MPPRPQVQIDKIVILGLPGGPQGWSSRLASTGEALAAAPGPLYADAPNSAPWAALVVSAGLPANGSWTVQLSPGSHGGQSLGILWYMWLVAAVVVLGILAAHRGAASWQARCTGYATPPAAAAAGAPGGLATERSGAALDSPGGFGCESGKGLDSQPSGSGTAGGEGSTCRHER